MLRAFLNTTIHETTCNQRCVTLAANHVSSRALQSLLPANSNIFRFILFRRAKLNKGMGLSQCLGILQQN